MGTHPIFESDFDCLTELLKIGWCGDSAQHWRWWCGSSLGFYCACHVLARFVAALVARAQTLSVRRHFAARCFTGRHVKFRSTRVDGFAESTGNTRLLLVEHSGGGDCLALAELGTIDSPHKTISRRIPRFAYTARLLNVCSSLHSTTTTAS